MTSTLTPIQAARTAYRKWQNLIASGDTSSALDATFSRFVNAFALASEYYERLGYNRERAGVIVDAALQRHYDPVEEPSRDRYMGPD